MIVARGAPSELSGNPGQLAMEDLNEESTATRAPRQYPELEDVRRQLEEFAFAQADFPWSGSALVLEDDSLDDEEGHPTTAGRMKRARSQPFRAFDSSSSDKENDAPHYATAPSRKPGYHQVVRPSLSQAFLPLPLSTSASHHERVSSGESISLLERRMSASAMQRRGSKASLLALGASGCLIARPD